jgi:hypothetical protein
LQLLGEVVETVGVGKLEGVQAGREAVQVTSLRQELLRDQGQLKVEGGGDGGWLGLWLLEWMGVVGEGK